jgi:very-short-patch-repair endonuclease
VRGTVITGRPGAFGGRQRLLSPSPNRPEACGCRIGQPMLRLMTPPKTTQVARMMRKNSTWAEKLVWSWLRNKRFSAYKFRRQHPFGPHVLDFFCVEANLNIELDGFMHGFPDRKRADAARDARLEARGIRVMRFWNSRLRREKQEIRDAIWRALQERAPHALPEYCRPMCDGKKR